MTPASRLVCAGCGLEADPADPYPFRCRNAGTGTTSTTSSAVNSTLRDSCSRLPQETRTRF